MVTILIYQIRTPTTLKFYLVWNRNGVFVNVIKLKVLRWGDYLGLFGWALNAITSVRIKETQREF